LNAQFVCINKNIILKYKKLKEAEVKEKIIGVLGGMGPDATVDLLSKIIRSTPVKKEQDHCRIITDINPKIEDRTKAILSGKTGRVISQLRETAENLERAGADFIIIPCNTAHYFLKQIREAVNIEVLDMIEETALFISENFPRAKKSAVLATTATCRMNLYRRALSLKNISAEAPEEHEQKKVMTAIMLIKEQGGLKRAGIILSAAAGGLIAKGAELIIAGCTEIPLALSPEDISVPLIDPTEVLAKKAVTIAKGTRR
jgi:aspartate racemase